MCRPNTNKTEISPTKLCECELFGATEHSFWGMGIAQWLERRTCDRKVLQELSENFVLHGQLSVLTLISVSVPPLCYHSST